MKKALAGVLAVAMAGVLAGSAMAQVPNIQVYFDPAHTQTQSACGQLNTVATLYVVMNNWNMNVTGVDFSIAYPPSLIWLADNLPDGGATSTSIGASPGGIAIAYANCCFLNGFLNNEVLLPVVLWGPCDCASPPPANPQPLVVGGYTPLGKTQPTAIRKEDFAEFSGLGMTSLICPGAIATEPTTWGQVKALYR
jgi:hypothetical protein